MIHSKSSKDMHNTPSLLTVVRTTKLIRAVINSSVIAIKHESIITFEILDISNLNSEDWSGMITNFQLFHKESSRYNTQMTGPIPFSTTPLTPSCGEIHTFIEF